MNDATASAALTKLDKLLEHRTRLGICVLLTMNDAIAFARFKTLLNETDGNLGAQLRKLEESGYIEVEKKFEGRKPISWYQLTDLGRRSLAQHMDAMSALFDTQNLT